MNRSYFRLLIFATLLLMLSGCAGSQPPRNPNGIVDGNFIDNVYVNPHAIYRGHGYYDEYQSNESGDLLK